jgi:hypothetical protein
MRPTAAWVFGGLFLLWALYAWLMLRSHGWSRRWVLHLTIRRMG